MAAAVAPAAFAVVSPEDLEFDDGGMTDKGAVDAFKGLLTFPTVSSTGHLDGANRSCVDFLEGIAKRIGLKTTVLDGPREGGTQPVLVAEWTGTDPKAPAVLLNAHYDVVPVIEEFWTKPAFAAHTEVVDGEERIYGRGAQDMKLVPIQYLVAISRLVAGGATPSATVFLSFVPDEEVGGAGMAWFLRSEYYKEVMESKIGCAFDEGIASVEDTFTAFYGERTPWWVLVEANGPTGHGSRFIQGTATHALHAFCARALAFRKNEEEKLNAPDHHRHGRCDHAKHHKLGDVTTVNLTMLKAGVSMDGGKTYAINVIPTNAEAGFDIRIPVTMPHATLSDTLTTWCREAEAEVAAAEGTLSWSFAPYGGEPLHEHHTTSVNPDESEYFKAFQRAVEGDLGIKLTTEVFPAATDSRFLRALKIPCFGFSPMRKCPVLLHEHDEYLPTSTFIEGPAVYVAILRRVLLLA